MNVLITGGAGFVGANLAVGLSERRPDWTVTSFDNLRRRGSELNLARLRTAGVAFVHGDVRTNADLDELGEVDCVVACSAEASATAGISSDLGYLVATNLIGAHNCLAFARARGASVVFLSTSRVYPVAHLRALRLVETDTRFELSGDQPLPGASRLGVSEAFPTDGSRTFYGATKLAAELLMAEYHDAFGLRTVVDRCGVVAGPWQMGRSEQGVFTYWLLSHYFNRPLRYLGFGGRGKQVRDLLHIDDLVGLVERQIADPVACDGGTFNVGGGRASSLSLLELTAVCSELTGNTVPVASAGSSPRDGDVPLYISDCSRLSAATQWRPERGPVDILTDVFDWIRSNERAIKESLAIA